MPGMQVRVVNSYEAASEKVPVSLVSRVDLPTEGKPARGGGCSSRMASTAASCRRRAGACCCPLPGAPGSPRGKALPCSRAEEPAAAGQPGSLAQEQQPRWAARERCCPRAGCSAWGTAARGPMGPMGTGARAHPRSRCARPRPCSRRSPRPCRRRRRRRRPRGQGSRAAAWPAWPAIGLLGGRGGVSGERRCGGQHAAGAVAGPRGSSPAEPPARPPAR
jgi:hypothetical protein